MSEELKASHLLNHILKYNIPVSEVEYKNAEDAIVELDDLQAQLAKLQWVKVSERPENLRERPTTEAWETYYYILEESSAMPQVMRADEIWLNEGSNVEFYSSIPPLPDKEKSDE